MNILYLKRKMIRNVPEIEDLSHLLRTCAPYLVRLHCHDHVGIFGLRVHGIRVLALDIDLDLYTSLTAERGRYSFMRDDSWRILSHELCIRTLLILFITSNVDFVKFSRY